MKKTLAATNVYISSKTVRMRLLANNVYESSVVEGARGLRRPGNSAARRVVRKASSSRVSKKAAKASKSIA